MDGLAGLEGLDDGAYNARSIVAFSPDEGAAGGSAGADAPDRQYLIEAIRAKNASF